MKEQEKWDTKIANKPLIKQPNDKTKSSKSSLELARSKSASQAHHQDIHRESAFDKARQKLLRAGKVWQMQ